MNDVMLDLETMGCGPDAAVIAIGAVFFDAEIGLLGHRFYVTVDLESSVLAGGRIDASTVLWWMKQSDEARKEFEVVGMDLDLALKGFSDFVLTRSGPGDVRIWGNGASFDNVILASAYKRLGIEVPWEFWDDRCYRTVKNLRPDVKMERVGEHHNALDDAVSQATHIMQILKER